MACHLYPLPSLGNQPEISGKVGRHFLCAANGNMAKEPASYLRSKYFKYPLQTGHILRILSSLNSHRMRITFPVFKGY